MIILQGLRLDQKGYTLYVTSATVEQLKNWKESDRIRPDIWKREMDEGYQRQPDKKRFQKIADYLEGKLRIEETISPNSLILNIRQKGAIDFDRLGDGGSDKDTIQTGKIKINDEALPFMEVDGQHRIRGFIHAYEDLKQRKNVQADEIKNFPIPITIIEGLDRAAEAMQFAVINTTQKKVDPDLVLRILHKRYRDKGERLEFFLRGQTWRLWAVEICDRLNSDPDSAWCDKIIAPGDERKGKIISSQNFVNSLEPAYRNLDSDVIRQYLPLYWKAISNLWPECTGDEANKYSLQRTNGTNVFHWLFPFVYFKTIALGNVKIKEILTRLLAKRWRSQEIH